MITARGDEAEHMTDHGYVPQPSEWDWVTEKYPDGIRLMFIRGIAPEQIIAAFGADPAAAHLLTAAEALDTIPEWFQVGQAGDWAFCIDNSAASVYEYQRITRELSAGTELALIETGPNFDHFYFYANSEEVTSFEPINAHHRYGSDPDRFVPQMRQAGLDVDPPPEDAELGDNPTLALLNTLTLALGIRLPREQALGPLPTVGVTMPLSGN
jgi:hypothetical protein